MSYTPTNWQTGDTVTAEKLNKMEQGIENANDVFVITLTPTNQDFSGTIDKTYEEIVAAVNSGVKIFFKFASALYPANEIIINASLITVGGTFLVFDNISTQSWYLIKIQTNPNYQTYSTVLFPVTPMS